MSVFTPLSDAQLNALLQPLGYTLLRARPALHGIENTNYLLDTLDQHQQACPLVLTVMEEISPAQLPWFVALLKQCQANDLPVPAPVCPPLTVADKPALLVPLFPGQHPQQTTLEQCHAIGASLATLHQTDVPNLDQANDATALERLSDALTLLPENVQAQAQALLNRWHTEKPEDLLIHGDLFRDNALFDGNSLTGLLDFYAAGKGPAIFDLAVAINDWCRSGDEFNQEKEQALLAGYDHIRQLTGREQKLMPLALVIAALRFWLSRLLAEQRHQQQDLPDSVSRKDPAEFENIYRQRLQHVSDQP